MPIWTLKLGSVVVTLASTAGFWNYVTTHVHPVKAALHPRVVQQAQVDSGAARAWDLTDDSGIPASGQGAGSVVIRKVVIPAPQQQVQGQAALGASWIANQTGQKPVTNTHTS